MALSALLSLLAVLWLVLIYAGLGRALFFCLRLAPQATLLSVTTRIALGFGMLGNVVMALCFLQQAAAFKIQILLILATLAGLPWYRSIIAEFISIAKRAYELARQSPVIVRIVLAILLAGFLARGLLPPTDFDALMYHLSTVKLYLAHGGFWHIYFNPQSDFPMLTEMNFLIGLALHNDIICKTISCPAARCRCQTATR